MQGFPGLLGSTGRLVVLLRRCYRGQEGRGTTGGEGSRWRSKLLAAVLGSSGAIPMIAGAEVEGGGLGKLPGVEEKLRWGLAGAGVQRCGGSAVVQGALRGGASGR
jgi:hypothetical protein